MIKLKHIPSYLISMILVFHSLYLIWQLNIGGTQCLFDFFIVKQVYKLYMYRLSISIVTLKVYF